MTTWVIDQMDKNGNVIETNELELSDAKNAWDAVTYIPIMIAAHVDCQWVSIRRKDVE